MTTRERPDMSNTGPAPAETAAIDAGEPESELDSLRRDVADLREKNLRLVADAQNQQKRLARERQESLRYAEADFARELLPILDDLERTLDSARTAADAAAVADGVRIVVDQFQKLLQQRGITPIAAAGEPFDPALHEALMQQPSAEQPAGSVLQELHRGYRMHDRVLRPARVIVSSGPPGES